MSNIASKKRKSLLEEIALLKRKNQMMLKSIDKFTGSKDADELNKNLS